MHTDKVALFFFEGDMKTARVSDLSGIINKIAPPHLAEEWDNVGLQVGNAAAAVTKIMVALDPGRAAVEAAVAGKCQLLLTHHPLIFHPLKRITCADPLGQILQMAIKKDLAVIAAHTNYDVAEGGMNDLLAERLGVGGCVPLKITGSEELVKLVVFVPIGHEERILEALFKFSGSLGNYRDCSFRTAGVGTFTPLEGAQPFLGKVGKREAADEARLEVLLRKADLAVAVNALIKVHPYEEPAFDLYPLLNRGGSHGLGRIGELPESTTLGEFAVKVKERLAAAGLRFVGDAGRPVKKVALCSGSGASLLQEARRQGADLLLTGDIKYHEARAAEDLGMALIDAGHFATEVLMVEGLAARLRRELEKNGFTVEVEEYKGEREPFSHI